MCCVAKLSSGIHRTVLKQTNPEMHMFYMFDVVIYVVVR